MEITRQENLMVAAIRAERFETDSLLHDEVTRGTVAGTRALLPGRSSGDVHARCCFTNNGTGHDAPRSASDVFEFAARDPENLAFSRPDPPATVKRVVVFEEIAVAVSAAGVMPGTGVGVGVGGMLDVFA